MELGLNKHSTKLYFFEYNEMFFLYYSNSGLGIQNHVHDKENKTVSPKIFTAENNKIIFNIITVIEIISNKLKLATTKFFIGMVDSLNERMMRYMMIRLTK